MLRILGGLGPAEHVGGAGGLPAVGGLGPAEHVGGAGGLPAVGGAGGLTAVGGAGCDKLKEKPVEEDGSVLAAAVNRGPVGGVAELMVDRRESEKGRTMDGVPALLPSCRGWPAGLVRSVCLSALLSSPVATLLAPLLAPPTLTAGRLAWTGGAPQSTVWVWPISPMLAARDGEGYWGSCERGGRGGVGLEEGAREN